MSARKDFSQVALDVVRKATGQQPLPEPTKPQKQLAPKVVKGTAKKKAKKPGYPTQSI